MGAIALQGPHHCAQKSTRTGVLDSTTSVSNELSVIAEILLLMIPALLKRIRHFKGNYAAFASCYLSVCHPER